MGNTEIVNMQPLTRITGQVAPRVLSACGRTTAVRTSGGGGYGRGAEHNKNIVWSEALLKPATFRTARYRASRRHTLDVWSVGLRKVNHRSCTRAGTPRDGRIHIPPGR